MNRAQFCKTFYRNVIFATINNCVIAKILCDEHTTKNVIVLNVFIAVCSGILSRFITALKFIQIFSVMQAMCCSAFYVFLIVFTYFAKYIEFDEFVNFHLIHIVLGSSFFNIYFAFAITNIEYTGCAIESVIKAVFKLFIDPPYLAWKLQQNKIKYIHKPYQRQFESMLFAVSFYEYVILSVWYLLFCDADWICDMLWLHTMIFLLTFGCAFYLYCKRLDCSPDVLLTYMTIHYVAVTLGWIGGMMCGITFGFCFGYLSMNYVLLITLITFVPLYAVTGFIVYLLRPSFKKTFQFKTVYPKNETCAICLLTDCEKFVKMHNCQHVFHPSCIKQWIERGNYNCVYCQKDVRKIE